MSKEITLEELAASSRPNTTAKTETVETNNESSEKNSSNIKGGSIVSVNDLGSHLREVHGLPDPHNQVTEDAPLVRNAFESMKKTIEERKERIENEFMPIVEANAMDMAMAREMGVDVTTTKLDQRDESIDSIPTVDNSSFDTSENNDYVEDQSFNEENDEYYDDDEEDYVPEEKHYIVHAEPEPTYNKPTREETTSIINDEDDEDLDGFIKEIESEEERLNVESDDEEETTEELRERFKESLTSVKISKSPIDLNRFKIRRTAVSSAAVLSNINNKNQQFKRADWVLFHTGRSMTFTECRGPELDSLRKTINNSNGINGVVASLKFIYNHVVDANKPDFESWCKLIRTEDIESLYFGLYRACYADSNLVARACMGDNGCKKTSLIYTDINEMVKYEDDKTKSKFEDLFNHDTTSDDHTFESELIQISDNFVISYSMPTLYSTFLQFSTLKQEITEKYSDILNTMAYIDGFFSIDRESEELVPISIKEYPNNINKTVLSKLKVYTAILKTLTNDQYNILTAKLNNIIQNSKVTYIYPETTCPECGTTITEEPVDSVLNLLFTRAQLVQIKSL